MNSGKDILVYWNHFSEAYMPQLMGTLSIQLAHGKEVISFSFSPEWLKRHPEHFLDPDLQWYTGPQFSAKGSFGLFMDSAPDRWGRRLMLRREAIRARKCAERPRPLFESDFLLGVYDENRMGALRFKAAEDGCFLNDDGVMSAPPWTFLRELEEASRRIDDDTLTNEHERWLAMLLAPGSSLGGARPKACVKSPDGRLWLAKFPGKNDTYDVAAWEYALMRMAKQAGLLVSENRLESFSSHGSTFLTRRFDRNDDGSRIHFASAMTLLGQSDGAGSDNGACYLDLAELIVRRSIQPKKDLHELWKRLVFSIAVSNTDDHLRNHGFLWNTRGWTLSPVYDLNPNPQGTGLSLNINMEDNSLDFSLAMEVAPFFQLTPLEANNCLQKVRAAVSNWKSVARHCGIAASEIESMTPAFHT